MYRIAIYGIGGLFNYGCEAIVRGTVYFIRKMYGEDCQITYYSRNYDYDKSITDEIGINIENIDTKSTFFTKCVSKAIDILKIQAVPFFNAEFEHIISNSDIIFSVGGDIYTIPAYTRNQKRYRYVNYLVEFGEKALKKGKKLFIYGASIGPFGSYDKALEYYRRHFKKVSGIICREQTSVDYLKTLDVADNVALLPDPAYLVKDQSEGKTFEKKYIGINLSGLSIYELYGGVNESVFLKLADLLANISRKNNKPLMLIPHVLNPYEEQDNDEIFLEKLYEKLPEDVKAGSVLVHPESFIDAKNYLKQCAVVAAARMHCAVNAITVGTPAIFLAYSSKALGMSDFVYGSRDWCIDLKNIESELPDKIEKMLNESDAVKALISDCRSKVTEHYAEYFSKHKEDK